MKEKLKAHLLTLPRWFAAPFFGGSLLLGCVLAGGIETNAWIALAAGMCIMAGGHSFNSFLDYAWTGLDRGEERSVEKDYCGGQSIIEMGIVSAKEVALNACAWYGIAMIPVVYLAINVSWILVPVALGGMLTTFWYSKAKFNYTHELALGVGVGPVACLLGMFAVNPHPPIWDGLMVSAIPAMVLSFAGLPLDEWEDAEANLKKGVKSVAYKVWEYGVNLEWYLLAWITLIYLFQLFLIVVGVLAPLTGVTFVVFPGIIVCSVFLKHEFRKAAGVFVLVASLHPILLLVGQALGG